MSAKVIMFENEVNQYFLKQNSNGVILNISNFGINSWREIVNWRDYRLILFKSQQLEFVTDGNTFKNSFTFLSSQLKLIGTSSRFSILLPNAKEKLKNCRCIFAEENSHFWPEYHYRYFHGENVQFGVLREDLT